MARTVARFILLSIVALVVVMTYLAMTKTESKDTVPYEKRDHLHILMDRASNAKGADFKKIPERIHVNYPVEHVAGFQEVAPGVISPKKKINNTLKFADNISNIAEISKEKDEREAKVANGDVLFQMPVIPGENIVSMTLYGQSMRYTMGAIRNAELVKQNYPGWKLRIYTENPAQSRYGGIPSNVMESLRALGADFYFMQPGEDFIPPMMWRFLIADDIWVDHFIVRDADARLTQRDAAATYDWIKSDFPFTCIRDHPSHAGYAISGGLWGAKPRELRNILRRSWRDLMRGVPSQYLQDMDFLNTVIWPKVQNHSRCLDSVSCDRWPSSYPFPVPRYGYEHVGQVVNEHDMGRPMDLQLLRNSDVNKNCTPSTLNTDTHSRDSNKR